jgi:hypothetical protein
MYYEKGDIIKVKYLEETPFWATIIDITDFYGYYETIAYKRLDNNECSFIGANYIIEVIPPIPRKASIDESIGEQRQSI